MSISAYPPSHASHESKLKCKDCNYETDNSSSFNDHVHNCPSNPIPLPRSEFDRRLEAKKMVEGKVDKR